LDAVHQPLTDFGVPQARERMFLIGCRTGVDITGCSPLLKAYATKRASVRKVLLALGPAGARGNARTCKARVTTAKNPVLRNSPYAGMLFNGQGRPINPDGLCSTLPASMGGNRTPIIDEDHLYRNKPSWVERYHRHLRRGGAPWPDSDVPSSLRRLTIDEALRIQTFPDNYKFHGRQSSVYAQIGNAVPPNLAHAVARLAVNILEENYDLPKVRHGSCEEVTLEFEYA
jgi:DNA (cytosine-5)-methyltransferase 1